MEAWQWSEAHSPHALPECGLLHRQQGHVALNAHRQHCGLEFAVVAPALDLDLPGTPSSAAAQAAGSAGARAATHLCMVLH